jgi:LmbE family N-acetylglucosaminyl deacetylase
MVLSPHPDDVVLAAGGLVQAAIERGVTVQTVIVTNGDEPILSPVMLYSDPSPVPSKELSKPSPHSDTLAAFAELGISDPQRYFLGLPVWSVGNQSINNIHG